MMNENNHLEIPTRLQTVLQQIDEMPLYLAELPVEEHPKLTQFNRFIQVKGIEAKGDYEFVHFIYAQVLKDKETGEIISIPLPTPDWVVNGQTWSYFRGQDGEPVELPIKEEFRQNDEDNEAPTTDKVKVPSYRYMLWLMKYQNVKFLELIQNYTKDFVRAKIEELNRL
ncbi:hypothetical protein [Bergeyella zoohelcum]|uniref:hypothetical protein n=1 Tax=Bergeyella zoohelcum TaxID=1015 RepID=UPI002A910004|nr:hypothetical protein [Bergeyella zoohelcum]MDY6025959.1 hypothetical protein [Bergeyella zoohelcum]